jgi:hypothetical protein
VTINMPLSGLKSETCYAINCYLISDGTPGGSITFKLVDGIGGTALNDAAGNANTITVSGAGLSTSWETLSANASSVPVFRTPVNVPAIVYLQITFAPTGQAVWIDHLAFGEMVALYDGGPLVRVFGGRDAFVEGDTFGVAVANDRAGTFNEHFNRSFQTNAKGIQLPYAGSPTIPANLIS